MPKLRLALAQPPYAASPDESVDEVERMIREAAAKGASVVAFPECYVPGYRGLSYAPPPPDPSFLERAWRRVSEAARAARIGVVLGTERLGEAGLFATVLVVGPDGERLGFQDKVQLDPSEDETYVPGDTRRTFTMGALTFGVVICHEGWRYPETTRWAVRHGAQVVFHPHLHAPEPGDHRPTRFGERETTFHERSILSRAAENTAYFASVNYAIAGSATSSAVAAPDGTLVSHLPYGDRGVLAADIDTDLATGKLAKRYRLVPA
jgi:predicted amidohydrolase